MDGLSTLDDLDVEGRRVLLRADFNVPLTASSPGATAVADDTRIRAALPTIEELLRRGARLVLVSHLHRAAHLEPGVSMRPVAERLAALSGATVRLAPDVTGPEVRQLTEQLAPGAMLMLENVRFAAGETDNDPRVASALAELADLYVDDAFACADRAYASTESVAHLLPCAAGRLMEREILALSAIVDRPARPLVTIIGGASVRRHVALIRSFLNVADLVCIGGAMCVPFLVLLGRGIDPADCQVDDLERARLALAGAGTERLALPSDLRLGTRRAPSGTRPIDIGPETVERYAGAIHAAATVLWSGPMGRFELAPFDEGTRAIAEAIAVTSATTVVVGPDAAAALRAYGLQDRVNHLSNGGGAALEFLAGRALPGIEALRAARAGSLGRAAADHAKCVTTTHPSG